MSIAAPVIAGNMGVKIPEIVPSNREITDSFFQEHLKLLSWSLCDQKYFRLVREQPHCKFEPHLVPQSPEIVRRC